MQTRERLLRTPTHSVERSQISEGVEIPTVQSIDILTNVDINTNENIGNENTYS